MLESNHIEIHETAFVTSTFRASHVNLSKDVFAHLWSNPKTEKWINEYLQKVSSEETFTHCLRNRYFLESIKASIKTNGIEVLINFGAGFSMYPFLLDKRIINIEIDKAQIVEYKKSQIGHWQKTNVLPIRNIHFLGVDFSIDYKDVLLSEIKAIKKTKSALYLSREFCFFSIGMKRINCSICSTIFRIPGI